MADEPIILRNRNRYKSFQFSMYHRIVCQDGKCHCGNRAKMGRDERGEYARAERSVFIPPRGQTPPLPASVLKIPQVKRALAEPNFIEIVGVLTEVQVFKPILPPPPPKPVQGAQRGPKGR